MRAPTDLHPYIVEFCQAVSAEEPIYITPSPGADDIVLDCIGNVGRKSRGEGGEAVLGWKIWEWPGVMVEAEFHAVWRSPLGTLQDITPNQVPVDCVLFLPDPALRYESRQIDNVRRALIKDPRVQQFINVAERQYEIMNRGERADQYGEINLPDAEAKEYQALEQRKLTLMMAVNRTTPGRNDLCRCGSGRKFKRCCGS